MALLPMQSIRASTAPTQKLCLITEGELFGQQVMQRRRRSKASESPDYVFKNLAELKVGSPVVHIEHGVGRYQGLVTLEVDRSVQEFLMLTYADDAKLYVPVSSLHLISRFGGGDQVAAPLNRLGTDKWDKAKEKAAKQVRDTAVELLDIYSRRAARKGFACTENEEDYRKFSSDFSFRGNRRSAGGHRCSAPRPAELSANGSPGVRGCGLWQNRGGHARRLYGGLQR